MPRHYATSVRHVSVYHIYFIALHTSIYSEATAHTASIACMHAEHCTISAHTLSRTYSCDRCVLEVMHAVALN
jgi:hypothetical protein